MLGGMMGPIVAPAQMKGCRARLGLAEGYNIICIYARTRHRERDRFARVCSHCNRGCMVRQHEHPVRLSFPEMVQDRHDDLGIELLDCLDLLPRIADVSRFVRGLQMNQGEPLASKCADPVPRFRSIVGVKVACRPRHLHHLESE